MPKITFRKPRKPRAKTSNEQKVLGRKEIGLGVTEGFTPFTPARALTGFDRRVQRSIKKVVEPNSFRTSLAATSFDNSGQTFSLSDIAQGNGDNNRTGDMVTPVSLEFKAQLVVGDATNLVRVVIYRWLEDDGDSAPTLTKVLSGPFGDARAPLSAWSLDGARSGRFEVLRDWLINLNTANASFVINEVIKLDPIKQLCYYAAGTSGTNKIYISFVGDSGAVPNPSIIYLAALNFYGDF